MKFDTRPLQLSIVKMKRSRVPPIVAAHDNEVEQEEEEDRKNRFNHLLKPIRDLAENFNINLACELEEYLDELETITISFNDEEGIKQLNFAEAALLIRGSSLIYSKKVDYLYDLVFKVLDNVTAQKDKRIRVDLHNDDNEDESGDAGGKKTSSSQADFVDAFLALDDIQEAQNISLNNEALSGQQQRKQVEEKKISAIVILQSTCSSELTFENFSKVKAIVMFHSVCIVVS